MIFLPLKANIFHNESVVQNSKREVKHWFPMTANMAEQAKFKYIYIYIYIPYMNKYTF